MVKAFYQSVRYEPVRERWVTRARPGPAVFVNDRIPGLRTRMLDYFEQRSAERAGVLHGEYLMHPTGLLLLDREGFVTGACASLEDPAIAPWLADGETQFFGPFYAFMRGVGWDSVPLASAAPIFADPYERNYFHFTMELAPRARFFPSMGFQTCLISKASLERPFQVDLMRRCWPNVGFHVLEGFVRVRDPVIAHDAMSEEGVHWLRGASGISAQAGGRRIYVRRSGRGTRSENGGSLSETPALQAFLAEHGFEWVEFGNGELGVAEQVARLEGAGVILAAHGAALSNLAFLKGPARVIEVLGPRTHRAMFMHISAMLGFSYYGLASATCDADGDIVVDLEELSAALRWGE